MVSDLSRPDPLPGDSFWVEEGLLLAGPYPGAIDQSEATAKLEAFLDVGITTFVDLTETDEPSPSGIPLEPYDEPLSAIASRRAITVRHVRMPIRDVNVPTTAEMVAILALINTAIAEREAVYVHCCGGIGRTGTVIGCWLTEQDAPPESALDELAALRTRTERALKRSPETEEQRQFVRVWEQSQTTT
jgi:protein tyrosine/serine phosphatase